MENPAIIIKCTLCIIYSILEQYSNETNYTRASVYVLTSTIHARYRTYICDMETATNSRCSITNAMPVKN